VSFARAVAHVLAVEGGYVDNPADPGGATAYGISQRAYPNLDIRSVTPAQAAQIYNDDYWAPLEGDLLPDAVSFVLLDFAVNSGVRTAVEALQRAIGVTVDGKVGPETIAASRKPGTVTMLSVERLLYLTKLAGWPTFGRGWAKRVIDTALEAM